MADWDADLDELRWHWDTAYLIHFFETADKGAQRRDSHATMSADSADSLLGKIRADYARQPVGRRIAGADRPETPGCRFLPEG